MGSVAFSVPVGGFLSNSRVSPTMLSFNGLTAVSVFLSSALASAIPKPITPRFPLPKSEQLSWAQYSPYFPHAEYQPPPRDCEIDQVMTPVRFLRLSLTVCT